MERAKDRRPQRGFQKGHTLWHGPEDTGGAAESTQGVEAGGQEQEGPHPPRAPSLAHSRLESRRICLAESIGQPGSLMVEGTCTTAWEGLLKISEESDSEQIAE